MFKYVLFAALLAFASAKPNPLVVEYPVATADYYPVVSSAYSAPVAYSGYDYALSYPYAAYTYASPAYYLRR